VSADVTIVIVTYNSEHVVGDLLKSIPGALDGISADVVVVDNGSADNTISVVESLGHRVVVAEKNLGYAGGLNLGVRSAPRSPAILLLNPDLRMHEHAVPVMLEALKEPRTGIVAPKVLSEDGSVHRSLRREPSLGRTLGLTGTNRPAFAEYLTRPEEYAEPRFVDWALGAALLISRDVYDELGGWDESYFLYSEETDFCLRARDRGILTRYEPGATVMHIGGGSGQSGRTHSMQIVNRVRLYRRRHNEVAAWAYLLLTAAREAVWIRRNPKSREAFIALFRPSRRPAELGCSDRVIPR
jgi:GT2 family glycosyltransferase